MGVTTSIGNHVTTSNFSALNVSTATTAASPIFTAALVIVVSCQVEVSSTSDLANSFSSPSWCHASTPPSFIRFPTQPNVDSRHHHGERHHQQQHQQQMSQQTDAVII